MKKIPLLFILLFSLSCLGQFSKTHYIPPLTSNPTIAPQDHYIYISTPSIQDVKFKIIPIGGTTISATVNKRPLTDIQLVMVIIPNYLNQVPTLEK